MIRLRRAYEAPLPNEGTRYLVERLWPRGIKKSDLEMDAWLKDVAPSTELRRWFGHDPAKWTEFRQRYAQELRANPEAWAQILDAAEQGEVTLLFSSRDVDHNNAVALKAFLDRKLHRH